MDSIREDVGRWGVTFHSCQKPGKGRRGRGRWGGQRPETDLRKQLGCAKEKDKYQGNQKLYRYTLRLHSLYIRLTRPYSYISDSLRLHSLNTECANTLQTSLQCSAASGE